MCRSSSDGGRRCSSSGNRSTQISSAQRQVQRATHRLRAARAGGDADQISEARAALDSARTRLDNARHDTTTHADANRDTAGHARDTTPAEATTQADNVPSAREIFAWLDKERTAVRERDRQDAAQRRAHAERQAVAGQHGDTTPPNPAGARVINYAAPGAQVGRQGDVISGETIVMGRPSLGAPSPDVAARIRATQDAASRTTHGTTVAFQVGNHNVAGPGDTVAFQVGSLNQSNTGDAR